MFFIMYSDMTSVPLSAVTNPMKGYCFRILSLLSENDFVPACLFIPNTVGYL